MTDLADAIGRAILVGLPARPTDHLALVERAAEADRVAGALLQQAVATARANGHSWSAVGSTLGLTRQAAQQRFGRTGADTETSPGSPETRWLGPVTALDEMNELEIAGRLGWHTVGAGLLRHRMIRTETQWEHRRVLWSGSLARYEQEGWQVGCRAFPWIYLIRDTGEPHAPIAPTSSASPTK